MYSKEKRDRFYQQYLGIIRRAPEKLQETWDESVTWIEGLPHPYTHKNVTLLPDTLKAELDELYLKLKKGDL